MVGSERPKVRGVGWPLVVGGEADGPDEDRLPGTVPNTMGREALVVAVVTALLVAGALLTQGWISVVLWAVAVPGSLWLAHVGVVLIMGYAVRRWFDSLAPKRD